jgi:hypothetical protein
MPLPTTVRNVPEPCRVCSHPEHVFLSKLLLQGLSPRAIKKRGVGRQELARLGTGAYDAARTSRARVKRRPGGHLPKKQPE